MRKSTAPAGVHTLPSEAHQKTRRRTFAKPSLSISSKINPSLLSYSVLIIFTNPCYVDVTAATRWTWVEPTVESCCFNLFCFAQTSGRYVGSLRQVCQLSLRCPFFERKPKLVYKVGSFRILGRASKKGLRPSFQDKFGVQMWSPDLESNSGTILDLPSHAFFGCWLRVFCPRGRYSYFRSQLPVRHRCGKKHKRLIQPMETTTVMSIWYLVSQASQLILSNHLSCRWRNE